MLRNFHRLGFIGFRVQGLEGLGLKVYRVYRVYGLGMSN